MGALPLLTIVAPPFWAGLADRSRLERKSSAWFSLELQSDVVPFGNSRDLEWTRGYSALRILSIARDYTHRRAYSRDDSPPS